MLSFVVMSMAFSKLAHPPFRLRLEDTKGMKPSIYRSYDGWIDAQQNANVETKYTSTATGHILMAHPLSHSSIQTPIQSFVENKQDSKLCFVDAIYLFNSKMPVFTCFLTGNPSSDGLALRIDDTCTWILVSTCYDLISCNEYSCRINISEFKEIQKGFLRLLLS